MAKATGRDLNEFYNSGFPANSFHEHDCDWLDSGFKGDNLALDEEKKFELGDLGFIVDEDTSREISFQSAFRKWLKSKTTATILIEVEKSRLDEVKTQLKSLGLKLV